MLFFWHYLGNRLVTTLSNVFTNLNLSDMEVGYKVFKAEVLKGLRLKSNRFGVGPELTAKIAKGGGASLKFPSGTPAAITPMARRSPGGTASRRSITLFASTSGIEKKTGG